VTDEAFAMNTNIMKPYSGIHEKGNYKIIFNYRLSLARRVVENVFGIIVSVFSIFRGPILLELEKVLEITMTCVLLLIIYLIRLILNQVILIIFKYSHTIVTRAARLFYFHIIDM